MSLTVLPNRKCGSVQGGGTYAIGTLSPFGTLNAFTALVAPFPAEIANPRAAEVVSVPQTLTELCGLRKPAIQDREFKRLPAAGMADLWGIASGYKTVWDVIQETMDKGISRHIAQVPSVELPCPILMMHMNAVVDEDQDLAHFAQIYFWLSDHGFKDLLPEAQNGDRKVFVDERPWVDAESLGHVGDDTFMWHPYVSLYKAIATLPGKKLMSKFERECKIHMTQGVIGLGWITDFAYVLKPGETSVPLELQRKGVIAAVGEDDPRAAGIDQVDPWADVDEWAGGDEGPLEQDDGHPGTYDPEVNPEGIA